MYVHVDFYTFQIGTVFFSFIVVAFILKFAIVEMIMDRIQSHDEPSISDRQEWRETNKTKRKESEYYAHQIHIHWV